MVYLSECPPQKSERITLRDTVHGELDFGFARRWRLDPNDTAVTNVIANQIFSSLSGKCFDIRIVERTTDTTGEVVEHESDRLTRQVLVRVAYTPGAGIAITTEEDMFHFGGSEQFGFTTVTQIGTGFHLFVPHATGMDKFYFYNVRRP